MRVCIDADCNGGAGIFYRLVNYLNDGKLKICQNLNEVIIQTPCEFNEKSFSNEKGGVYTQHKYETKLFKSKEFESKVTLAGPN
jgi:hypothetical protein